MPHSANTLSMPLSYLSSLVKCHENVSSPLQCSFVTLTAVIQLKPACKNLHFLKSSKKFSWNPHIRLELA